MDTRRLSLAVALCLVLSLLSGCTLLGPDATTTSTPTDSPASTPTSTDPVSPTGTTIPTPTATATPTPRTVRLSLRATTARPHTYVARFVDEPVERVTVRYANGSERTHAIDDGRLPAGALDDAVDLSPVAPVEREVRHTDATPTDGVTLRVPTTASDLFLVVRAEDRVVGWRYYTCGPSDVGSVDATVREAGLDTANVECLV